MKPRRLYKSLLLVATGCMAFQATGSCTSELMNSVVASVVPTVTSALADAVAGAVVGAIEQQNGS